MTQEPPREPSPQVAVAMSYLRDAAPPDIVDTIGWLQLEGWHPVNPRGGAGESFGNVAIDFARDGSLITIVRDRSQSLMYVRMPGWKSAIEVDIVFHTIAGRDDWSGSTPHPLPEQLPPGV